VPVAVSVDGGKSWKSGEVLGEAIDLTDAVKGHQQYWLKFSAGAEKLKGAEISWRTVCQTNVATIPHLKDGSNRITFAVSGRGLISAGPTKAQAGAHQVEGKLEGGNVTLELSPPRGAKASHVYAASWQSSGSPPSGAKYQIEYSTDGGKSWRAVVKDWSIIRRPPEPNDFWSQSFCWGDVGLEGAGAVRVRFSNNERKGYRKVEGHLGYEVREPSGTTVTFAWRERGGGIKTASHVYESGPAKEDSSWTIDGGKDVRTAWVEYAAK
jgi:hypothetical protein